MDKVQLIRDKLKTAQSHLKSDADVRRREISLMKRVMRFGKKGKLSPRYVGTYRILRRIGSVDYDLELLAELAVIHSIFHISLLKKCVGDPTSVLPLKSVVVEESLTYEKVPIDIFGR